MFASRWFNVVIGPFAKQEIDDFSDYFSSKCVPFVPFVCVKIDAECCGAHVSEVISQRAHRILRNRASVCTFWKSPHVYHAPIRPPFRQRINTSTCTKPSWAWLISTARGYWAGHIRRPQATVSANSILLGDGQCHAGHCTMSINCKVFLVVKLSYRYVCCLFNAASIFYRYVQCDQLCVVDFGKSFTHIKWSSECIWHLLPETSVLRPRIRCKCIHNNSWATFGSTARCKHLVGTVVAAAGGEVEDGAPQLPPKEGTSSSNNTAGETKRERLYVSFVVQCGVWSSAIFHLLFIQLKVTVG